jgi:hypothetical protein
MTAMTAAGTTPEQGNGDTPDQGGGDTPDQGGGDTPEQDGNDTPDQGGGDTPEQDGNDTPDQGGDDTPDQGGDDTPDQGGGEAGSGGSRTRTALLIAAASQTLRGRAQAGQAVIWLALAGDGTELNAALVTNVLRVLLTTRECFRNPVQCARVCAIISQDCKPCVADEPCRSALTTTCGSRSVESCGQ